ncbi:MAG TPA: DUF3806 domain-containing protein [Microvirga sp.]|nr:DUF3806 domain-containing protein [Microvirga sp.]
MTQVQPLSAEHRAQLERQRTWVRDHYEPHARDQFETAAGKLRVIDAILKNGWVAPEETWKLQSLGIAFGDAIAEHLGLSWVTVEDEYGRDPALQLPGTTMLLFPMTSLSKRIEQGGRVDVFELFESACERVRQVRAEIGDDAGPPA